MIPDERKNQSASQPQSYEEKCSQLLLYFVARLDLLSRLSLWAFRIHSYKRRLGGLDQVTFEVFPGVNLWPHRSRLEVACKAVNKQRQRGLEQTVQKR